MVHFFCVYPKAYLTKESKAIYQIFTQSYDDFHGDPISLSHFVHHVCLSEREGAGNIAEQTNQHTNTHSHNRTKIENRTEQNKTKTVIHKHPHNCI